LGAHNTMQYFVMEVVRHCEDAVPGFDTRVTLVEHGLEHGPVDQRARDMKDTNEDHQPDQSAVHPGENDAMLDSSHEDVVHQTVPQAPIYTQEPSQKGTSRSMFCSVHCILLLFYSHSDVNVLPIRCNSATMSSNDSIYYIKYTEHLAM
jgi:hypothetical protein